MNKPRAWALVCPIYLHPRVPEFLYLVVKQLKIPKFEKTISVANNACWAIGELAVQVPQEISPFVTTVISCLIPILHQSEGVEKSMVENSAITLGRLAFVCPDLVSPHMEKCMQSWCISLSTTRDGIEKEDAFKGLCAMVKANPSVAQSSLVYVCKAIASWTKIWSTELNTEVCKVMHDYQQMLTNEAWDKFMSDLDPLVKANIAKYLV